jgi:hypothetical protein
MRFIQYLSEMFLTEAAALTKGSQRVMNDKKLVAGLADAMRDDARSHPRNFPANSSRTFQKASDEELAQWFLENLDKIEKAGYEGTIYSRDGVYSDWIVRRYIAGSHNWEDIVGVMNMNLRDWTLLKNRDLLGAGHKDIPKFNSVRDVGAYVNTHYEHHLADIRDAAKTAALKKTAKSALIVDNDDYKIYTVFNRNAARMVGLGTQWCTANSASGSNYENYSKNAMLFQLFPTQAKKDETGRPEKFQFDASGVGSMSPNGFAFKDFLDHNVSPDVVRERFPYLYTDLVKGLKEKGSALEDAMTTMSDDPTLQGPDTKTKKYNIEDEIKKLTKMKNAGFFTDEVRPRATPAEEPTGDKPQVLPAPQQPEGNTTMENVDKDVAAMLSSLKKYDMLKESVSPVLGMVTLGEKKGEKPEWLEKAEKKAEAKEDGPEDKSDSEGGEIDEDSHLASGKKSKWSDDPKDHFKEEIDEKDEGKHNNGKTTGFKAVAKKAAAEYGSKEAGERVAGAVHAKMAAAGKLEETTAADPEVLEWMKRFSSLGKMSGY